MFIRRICLNSVCENEALCDKAYCYNCCKFPKNIISDNKEIFYEEVCDKAVSNFYLDNYHYEKQWLSANTYAYVYTHTGSFARN